MSLVREEKIVESTRLDFNKKTSNWLIKHGFKKEARMGYSQNSYYEYSHKELPLKIRPSNYAGTYFFGDYEISFCDIFYFDSTTGKGQESSIRSLGKSNDATTTLDLFAEKLSQAIALAKKFTELVNKKEIE